PIPPAASCSFSASRSSFFSVWFRDDFGGFFSFAGPLGKMDGWWVVRWAFSLFAGFRGVFRPFFHSRKKEAARKPPRLLTNSFREVWRARRPSKVDSYRPAFPGRSIVAAGAGRAH